MQFKAENTDYTISETGVISTSSPINLINPLTETDLTAGAWDYKSKYYFKIELYDTIYQSTPIQYTQYVKIGLPIYYWYRKNDVNHFNVNADTKLNGETTLGGKLKYSSNGSEDYAESGFIHDQHGNMTHKRATTSDNWHINNNAGSSTFMFYPETGDEKIYGDMFVNDNRRVVSFAAETAPSDFNNMTTAGCYFFTNISNSPCYNGWCLVLTFGAYVKQVVFRFGTVNSNDFNTYVRTKNASTWSNWTQIK